MKIKFIWSLAVTLLCTTQTSPQNIIFDLNDVLIYTSKPGIIKDVGIPYLASYSIKNPQSLGTLKEKTYTVLYNIAGQQCPPHEHDEYATGFGHTLPQSLCNWLAGDDQYQENKLIAMCNRYIMEHKNKFSGPDEINTIQNIIKTMLSAENIARNTHINPHGIKLLKKLSQTHTIYIFSNYAPEAYNAIMQKPEIRNVLYTYVSPDRICISGEHGIIKPYQNAFTYFCNYYNVTPKTCTLIDDQSENRRAAERIGMRSQAFTSSTIQSTKQKLLTWYNTYTAKL